MPETRPPISPATHRESARDLPVVDRSDVVVCGSGPAGIAAALAAARTGARVRLLETHGCLGGVWTAGLLTYVLDAHDDGGLMSELIRRLEEAGAKRKGPYDSAENREKYPWVRNAFIYDPERMKLLLERMAVEAGIDIRLHTRVCAAGRDEANRLAVVISESKSGREAWAAHAFVDATGDGDLSMQAGCGFDMGHPDTGQCQPMTMVCLLSGPPADELAPYVHEKGGSLMKAFEQAGVQPSYSKPALFYIRDGLYKVMANHEYGVSATSAEDITRATLHAREEMHRLIDALTALGGPWAEVKLVATPNQIGIREARRIRGRYQVSTEDLIHGARHDDAICRVTFPVDIHSTDPKKGKGFGQGNVKSQPYDIPLRAQIAADVDGLLMAGRCISGDFFAHASYRVTGNAVQMGQAAGVTAALAAREGVPPHRVPFDKVRRAMDQLRSNSVAVNA